MPVMTFRKVRCASRSDDNAIKLTLFRDETRRVCGWFLGPVRFTATGVHVPYLAKSERMMASIAIVRAIAESGERTPVCIIDPDDLWEPAWQG